MIHRRNLPGRVLTQRACMKKVRSILDRSKHISTNIQPVSRGELLGGAHCRQDHEPEIDHGDEHDTVSARYEPV